MRPTSLILALAATLPAAAGAQAPASGGLPLRAGDTVQFDLGALPLGYEGAGKAACKGTVVRAIGPQEEGCERTYRFEVPADGSRMTYVFRAADGRETRIDLPLTSDRRPVDFTAPADGSLLPPAPVTIPAEVADRAARAAAGSACGRCPGGGFKVVSFEVTKPPAPVGGSPSVRLKITTTVKPSAR